MLVSQVLTRLNLVSECALAPRAAIMRLLTDYIQFAIVATERKITKKVDNGCAACFSNHSVTWRPSKHDCIKTKTLVENGNMVSDWNALRLRLLPNSTKS